MFWIKHIDYENADKELKKIYSRVKGPKNNVDNILMIHSLRPHTLQGHMGLYKNVLHHANNQLPKWYLETIGVYVSHLNSCPYCVEHHFEGLKRLLNNDEKAQAIYQGILEDRFTGFLTPKEITGIEYAKMLTLSPGKIDKKHIDLMKKEGHTDGEILEVNQVVSYFNYANRTVLGLGVHTEGDLLGLSPSSSDDKNWMHQ